MLDAGHRRHLDRQRPAPREPQRRDLRADRGPRARDLPRPDPRRGRRGRARRPVAGGAAGASPGRQGLLRRSGPRSRSRTSSARTSSPCCGSSRCARSPRTSRRGAIAAYARAAQPAGGRRARPRARRAAAEVAAHHAPRLALGPAARHRDGRRLGAAARHGRRPRRRRRSSPRSAGSPASSARTSSRRRATTSSRRCGASPRERGSTYIFVGTPDESRRREIFGGSLLSRMVRELPGLDIRVVANRADRDRLTE